MFNKTDYYNRLFIVWCGMAALGLYGCIMSTHSMHIHPEDRDYYFFIQAISFLLTIASCVASNYCGWQAAFHHYNTYSSKTRN